MKRDQVPAFGTEFRALYCSKKTENQEAAAIIIDELDALLSARNAVPKRMHPKEETFTSNNQVLSGVRYLKLKTAAHSIRVYFVEIETTLWMLEIDLKRRTNMTDGAIKSIADRLAEARKRHAGIKGGGGVS